MGDMFMWQIQKKFFILVTSLGLIFLTACAPQDFSSSNHSENSTGNSGNDGQDNQGSGGGNSGTNPDPGNDKFSYQRFDFKEEVPYKPSQDYFQQDQLQKNQTSISFQVIDKFGKQVNNLKTSDLELFENGTTVPNFTLGKENTNLGQIADIVFVLDITGSMQTTIDECKAKVQRFVNQLAAKKIQANLCLVTFKDRTIQKCTNVVNDDPKTAKNENLDAFLNDLSKSLAEGGNDDPENQLRALIDAAMFTPWRSQAQRIAILMTDEDFHYSPDNKGDAGDDAPTYDQAIQAVMNYGMTVFNVAPDKAGYSKPFNGKKSLSQVTGGAFFDYQKMIDGKITMNSIFDSIVDQISTKYQVSFNSEDNPGLDPTVSIDKRQFQIKTKDSTYTVNVISKTSNWPTGRPEYKRRWKLSKKVFKKGPNFKVYLNEDELNSGYELIDGEVRFELPPAPGANVRIQYDPAVLRESITLKTWVLPSDLEHSSLVVDLNGYIFSFEDLRISQNSSSQEYYFDPNYLIGELEDPLGITRKRKLSVNIFGQRKIPIKK